MIGLSSAVGLRAGWLASALVLSVFPGWLAFSVGLSAVPDWLSKFLRG